MPVKKTIASENLVSSPFQLNSTRLSHHFMKKYILEDRKPVVCDNLMKWGSFYEKSDRIVKQENIGPYRISTVFLGLDHSFEIDPLWPVLFETMIFSSDERLDQYQERCSTWEQAEAMHAKAVKIVNKRWKFYRFFHYFRKALAYFGINLVKVDL